MTAALAGMAAWRLGTPAAVSPTTRFSIVLPEGQQLSATTRRYVAVSPDGTQVAYVANNRIFLRSVAEFDARPVTGSDEQVTVYTPAFSPDGESIAFYSSQDRAIKRVAATGGAAVTICPVDTQAGSISWEPSGIVFSRPENGIFRCSPNGGTPEQLATVQEGEIAHGPQLLLDGAALLFTIANPDDGASRWDTARIVVQTLATGERKTIVNGGTDARYLPTGHLVYAARGVLFAVPFDAAGQTVRGDPTPIVEGVRRASSAVTGATQFATSAAGTLVYVPGPTELAGMDRVLAIADRAGAVTRVAVLSAPYDHVRASRDGARLAIGTDNGQQANVWIYEVSGKSAVRRLTFARQNRYPIWAPDMRRVAFQSDREGDVALFAQSADGSGTVERLTKAEPGEAHVPESWSPDGRYILFSVRKGNRFLLRVLSVRDGKTEPYGGVESLAPTGAVFSPDGRWVAYASSPEGPTSASDRGVYVQPFPATGARYQVPKQQSIDFHPVWAPAGDTLLYTPTASSGQLSTVDVSRQSGFGFGNPASFPARVTAGRIASEMRAYDVLPDGRFVGVISASELDSAAAFTSSAEIRVVQNWHEELKRLVPAN